MKSSFLLSLILLIVVFMFISIYRMEKIEEDIEHLNFVTFEESRCQK